MSLESWQSIVAVKQASVRAKIPPEWHLPGRYLERVSEHSLDSVLSVPSECGLLSPAELTITEKYDAVSLLQQLAERVFTAEQVITAFSKRAAIAQQLTHCLTETFFDKGLERARFLDEYLAKEGKVIGPLHGLPISVKDSFDVIGIESTIGYVSFIGRDLPTSNAALVDVLLNLGAVLYVKTNIPQTLMTGDSENNIFGRTLNPHRLALTAGGSSGGEGALVALRGSLLGVGTDIAGSVRIPAQCDGTYGFKPSSARIPYGGQTTPSRAGSPGFLPSAGPLTNSFRDMELFCRAVISAQPQNVDSSCLGIPWRDVPTKERLVIGVLGEDPSLPLHPPVSRACSSAVSKLTAAGHNVKFLKNTPPLSAASRLSFAYFSLDSRNTRIQHILCSGEPRVNSVKNTAPQYPGRIPTVDELYDMNVERAKLIAEWDKIYLDNELDAIVGPGAPSTAVPHDTLRPPGYTMLWNLLDCPACVVPYLKADATIDLASDAIPDYDPKIVDGAPCSIQIAGRRLQDEELLAAAGTISEVLSS